MVNVIVCVQSHETFIVWQRVQVYTWHVRTKAELRGYLGSLLVNCWQLFSHLNIGIVLWRHPDLIILT